MGTMSQAGKLQPILGSEPTGGLLMVRSRARYAAKVDTLKTNSDVESWLFISCTFLMLASLIPMWSHWDELSVSLGFYPTACALAAVTGGALIVALWVNTENE